MHMCMHMHMHMHMCMCMWSTPQAVRPSLFKWLAAFCVLDCVGAATSPASCALGPNLACTKNFAYVPVNRCAGTIPGSLEMQYDPLLCSLFRAAARALLRATLLES